MATTPIHTRWILIAAVTAATIGACGAPHSRAAADESDPPALGAQARAFELKDLDGESRKLTDFTKEKGPVVLLVLRGFPGYQCPICSRQVGQFIAAADKFKELGATVLMIYPGRAEDLRTHAEEFIKGKTLPTHFHLLLDPDHEFASDWNLRWDAPGETAYPSTFVISPKDKILFAKISKTHGDRVTAEEVLNVLSSSK